MKKYEVIYWKWFGDGGWEMSFDNCDYDRSCRVHDGEGWDQINFPIPTARFPKKPTHKGHVICEIQVCWEDRNHHLPFGASDCELSNSCNLNQLWVIQGLMSSAGFSH
tara:strand:- start:67 stop:390 length:324 start_codon:yes stop_codon:yes gene_type:complete